jgi:PAS domain-containing protein
MDMDVQQLDSGASPERLRHEQEQAHFNELYLLAPVGYFVVAFDGRILQANVAGAQLIGVPRGAAGGHCFRDFVRRNWREALSSSNPPSTAVRRAASASR